MRVVHILADGSKAETIKDKVVKVPTSIIVTKDKTRRKRARDNF